MGQPLNRIRSAMTTTPRERLLDAATDLFCRLGVNSVGVDAIVDLAGTAKTTLYKTFGSKEALVEAVLEREGKIWREWFLGGLNKGDASARERLDRIVPLLHEWFAQEKFYGCPFINAVAEHDKSDDRMRKIALAHKSVVLARVEELLVEAQAANPKRLAHQLGIIIDGAIVAALITRDDAVSSMAGSTLACVLDAELPMAPKRRLRRVAG
jgi:AcrR family transcriptional regulator